MFAVEYTQIDHEKGTTTTLISKQRYRTERTAQNAADSNTYCSKPDGKTVTFEVHARVIQISGKGGKSCQKN